MVERKLSWLNGFQQLMMCFERGADIHQTIIGHGGALIAGITLSGFDRRREYTISTPTHTNDGEQARRAKKKNPLFCRRY